MTYLERLKKSKTPTMGTALTAKSPFDSFGSSDLARFQKINPPFGSKDSSDLGRFQNGPFPQKMEEGARPVLPKWCQPDCFGLETIPLPNEGEAVGCVHPITGSWRRLDWMTGCAALSFKRSVPPVPEWCRGSQSANYCQVDVPGLEIIQGCEIDTADGWKWARTDKLTGCPSP